MTLVSLPGPQTKLRNIFLEDRCVSTEKGKKRKCGINLIPESIFWNSDLYLLWWPYKEHRSLVWSLVLASLNIQEEPGINFQFYSCQFIYNILILNTSFGQEKLISCKNAKHAQSGLHLNLSFMFSLLIFCWWENHHKFQRHA